MGLNFKSYKPSEQPKKKYIKRTVKRGRVSKKRATQRLSSKSVQTLKQLGYKIRKQTRK